MCYEVTCSSCGKRSWDGCGRHVPGVYHRIPEGQHCHCKPWPGVGKDVADSKGSSSSSASGCAIL